MPNLARPVSKVWRHLLSMYFKELDIRCHTCHTYLYNLIRNLDGRIAQGYACARVRRVLPPNRYGRCGTGLTPPTVKRALGLFRNRIASIRLAIHHALNDGGCRSVADEPWIILRTSGRSTLKLADTLAEDGFDVWTPRETKILRKPRANVRREVTLPIMPSYIFARESQLIELLQMAKQDVKPRRGSGWGKPAHAGFSVMRYHDKFPSIDDRHLQALRQLERKAEIQRLRVSKAAPLPLGVTVRLKDGSHDAWSGMVGRVVTSSSGLTRIVFIGTRIEIAVRTSLLDESESYTPPTAKHASRHRNAAKYLGREAQKGKVLLAKCESVVEETDREAA